ncbi:60S acidic ribosomal protein P2-like [Malaclemys terrapin pileata]|uniref:60S acidic ribosomal protein P2-like n=1 Tax=Malaclemys terrapin pileata TaxID=2991368 RepID=UPI0023A7DCCA|nr:60S acidic ribosomal protein P2-like [Malaclemys terrapin pileata]
MKEGLFSVQLLKVDIVTLSDTRENKYDEDIFPLKRNIGYHRAQNCSDMSVILYNFQKSQGSLRKLQYPLIVSRYITLLAVLGGNKSPTSKNLKKILNRVDIETDERRLNKVIGELNGKNIEDVIAQGNSKLASMPASGAVAVSAGPGSAAPAEEKKEQKEESEKSDDDMGFGLLD